MTNTLRSSALIPAAGFGTRLGHGPKALLRIGEATLLEILVTTLHPLVEEIVVAAPAGYRDEFSSIVGGRARVTEGGATRQDSIERLLSASSGELLLIQDAARPFCSRALCRQVLEAATESGAAGAFLDPTVPVGRVSDGAVGAYLSRTDAGIFQAPQAFHRDVLTQAGRRTRGQEFQSTAQMVIDAGFALQAVAGEPENIKITTQLDWDIARSVLAPKLGLGTP